MCRKYYLLRAGYDIYLLFRHIKSIEAFNLSDVHDFTCSVLVYQNHSVINVADK